MSEEIKNVINGNYKNPQLDAGIYDLLCFSLLNKDKLDISAYMCVRELRTNVITDNFEDIYEDEEENILGL